MVAQRQPVDRVIDVVVGLPVATAVAARRSIPLVRQASRQVVRLIAERAREALGSVPDTSVAPTVEAALPSADRALEDVGVGAVGAEGGAETEAESKGASIGTVLPIDDYDHLAARQVVDRLASLTSSELAQVDVYERAHRHRQTVLGRIAQLTP